ncbi:MAG: AbrB/MazE/SpoVT family DNA-binding domain-containing protein [Gemmatimonadales bacterium]
MRLSEHARIGKRGTLVIPANLRKKFGLEEGTAVVAEETAEGVLLRPAVTVPLELYSPRRKAEFLLSNAVGARDYARAVKEVRRLGLDPDDVPHERPTPRKK